LGDRRVCRKCDHSFHIIFDKSKKEGVCDYCGGEVYAIVKDLMGPQNPETYLP
jgi:adenylate kinase